MACLPSRAPFGAPREEGRREGACVRAPFEAPGPSLTLSALGVMALFGGLGLLSSSGAEGSNQERGLSVMGADGPSSSSASEALEYPTERVRVAAPALAEAGGGAAPEALEEEPPTWTLGTITGAARPLEEVGRPGALEGLGSLT